MIKFTFKSAEQGEMDFEFKQPKPLRVAKLQDTEHFYRDMEAYVRRHLVSPDFEEAWEYIQDLGEDDENNELSRFMELMLGSELQKKSKRRRRSSATA